MSSNLTSAMLNSKIRPSAVVGYGVKIFHPSPPNYVTRSPGRVKWLILVCQVPLLPWPPRSFPMLNLLSNYNHIFTGAQLGEIAMQFSLLLETGYIWFFIFIGHRSADIVVVFFTEVVQNLK